jgi:2-phosphoglycerate kinase
MNAHPAKPAWDVLYVAGPSGVGKTMVSYPLACHYGTALTELDDLYITAEQLTTPDTHPLLHYWQTHPDAVHMSAEEILVLHLSVCRVMTPAIQAVIANHIETRTPVVLDGDYLLPEMVVGLDAARVKGVFLYEPDEAQIVQNYALREPDEGEQTGRARVSCLFGEWLRDECQRLGLIALPARPWATVQTRILDAVG